MPGMAGPGPEYSVVDLNGLFRRLRPGPVIGQRVGLQGPPGRSHEMKDRVVALAFLSFLQFKGPHDIFELDIVHIGPVVHDSPVADDQDPVRRHVSRRPLEDLFLSLLQGDLALLVLLIGDQGPGGHSPADELGGRLGNKQDREALPGKLLPDPLHGCRLSAARTACDHDLFDLHIHLMHLKRPAGTSVSP